MLSMLQDCVNGWVKVEIGFLDCFSFEGLNCAEVYHLDQLHFHNMKDYFQFKS